MRWLLPVSVACGAGEPVELLDGAAWAPLDASDPLAGEPCSSTAWHMEGRALEVSTDGCAPVALGAALPARVRRGDALELVWWHGFLVAPEPMEARLSLWLDGELLFESVRPIPSPPTAFTESFDAPVPGESLVVRIENHGANTWNLLRLTAD